MMNIRNKVIAFYTFIFFIFASQFAQQAISSPQSKTETSEEWEYLTAYGGGTSGWHVERLRASVRKTGNSVVIEAYYDDGRIGERITGTLQGSRFKGKRNIIFSEPYDEPVQGTYSQVKSGNHLHEVFTMSNQFLLLGVSRATHRK